MEDLRWEGCDENGVFSWKSIWWNVELYVCAKQKEEIVGMKSASMSFL